MPSNQKQATVKALRSPGESGNRWGVLTLFLFFAGALLEAASARRPTTYRRIFETDEGECEFFLSPELFQRNFADWRVISQVLYRKMYIFS